MSDQALKTYLVTYKLVTTVHLEVQATDETAAEELAEEMVNRGDSAAYEPYGMPDEIEDMAAIEVQFVEGLLAEDWQASRLQPQPDGSPWGPLETLPAGTLAVVRVETWPRRNPRHARVMVDGVQVGYWGVKQPVLAKRDEVKL